MPKERSVEDGGWRRGTEGEGEEGRRKIGRKKRERKRKKGR